MSDIIINIEDSEENRNLFRMLNPNSDIIENYRLLGLNCKIILTGQQFSVEIQNQSERGFLCGVLLQKLPICPNPNQDKYHWGSTSWLL